jgi:hypothetical protein
MKNFSGILISAAAVMIFTMSNAWARQSATEPPDTVITNSVITFVLESPPPWPAGSPMTEQPAPVVVVDDKQWLSTLQEAGHIIENEKHKVPHAKKSRLGTKVTASN